MESSNSNSKERELQLTQRLAKQRHSNCMTWFEQLETHLHDLYLLNSPYAVIAFKPAFRLFFGEEHQTFKLKKFHNLDQRELLENLDTLEAVIHRVVNTYAVLRMKENELNALKETETQMQRQEEKVNMREAVDAGLVVTESSSGSYTTQAVDADIRPVNDEEPFAEVQLTALHNILVNE
ncbi:hypothetical protein Tco_1280562 [Tanacetum coccineum]